MVTFCVHAPLNLFLLQPKKFPSLFVKPDGSKNSKFFNRFLFYGPPGTGKSHLAKAAAYELRDICTCFLNVTASDLLSKYQGESEKAVKLLFALAQKLSPCLIFLVCSAKK
jgi:vacuolar protein-sorting-associated protein 4